MARRRVIRTSKDDDGDILALCWRDSDGKVTHTDKASAIAHIRGGTHSYHVAEQAPSVDVKVRTRNGTPYLTTEADATSKNNLDNLPDCQR